MGMFDDLIPQQNAPAAQPTAPGMFDDLIPQPAPNQAGPRVPQFHENVPTTPEEKQLAAELRHKADRDLLAQAGPVAQSPWYAAASSFGNAGTLNVARNVAAAARALKTGKPFEHEYRYLKDIDEAAARESPWTAGLYGLLGAGAGAAMAPIAPAASVAGRAAQGAALGGGMAGAAELADSKDIGAALGAAGIGAALGGAATPLTEGAVKGLGAIGGRVAGAVRGVVNPEAEAARRVSAALARDARVGGQQLDDAALAAAQASGQPAVVADMGGRVTQSLARSAANTSPEARHALETVVSDRFEGQAPRVSEFVLGLGSGEDALATREALQRAAAAANRPAYQRAYAQGGSIWNEGLAQLAQAPDMAQAIKQATRTGANKAAADGFRPVKNPFAVSEAGEVTLSNPNVTPTLQFWDHVKRNLDDRISTLQRSGEKSAAADTIALRSQLVSYLDDAAPAYAEARAGAAKFFGAQDALEAGQKFVTARGKNSEFARVIGKMSEPERKLFADGFASEMATRINETGDRRSVLNSVFNSPNARARVTMALGPEKAKEFEAFMRVESMMDGLRRAVTGNSTTARQLAEAGMAGGIGAGLGGAIGNGDPRDISLGAMFGLAARSGKVRIDQRLAQRVGEMLSSSDPAVFRKAVGMVARNKALRDFIDAVAVRVGGAAASYNETRR
jgi:hypothetical protein